MFKYFKLTKKVRINDEEPKSKHVWIKHAFSELIGTLLLSMALAGLSTIVVGTNKTVEAFMLHPIIVGFYAGFIAVGCVLLIFLRWSCDLNPAVTITRMINGTNTYRYGVFKIVFQIIGGILAGLLIYAFGKLGNGSVSNHAISSIGADKKSLLNHDLNKSPSIISGSIWIFAIELVMTSILLYPIFSPTISNKYRDLLIMFIISMSVWMGILGGTAAINPARGMAQQVPALFFGHKVGNLNSSRDLISATIAMLAGTTFAPFFYVLVQGITEKYVNPFVVKIIKFKNYKSTNMKINKKK